MENFKELRKKINNLEIDINNDLQNRVALFYKETGFTPSKIDVMTLDVTNVSSLFKECSFRATVEFIIKPIR